MTSGPGHLEQQRQVAERRSEAGRLGRRVGVWIGQAEREDPIRSRAAARRASACRRRRRRCGRTRRTGAGSCRPTGSKLIAWLGRWRRNRKRSSVGGSSAAISCAAAPSPSRRAHLAAADVEELVRDVERRLALEDAAADRIGAVARPAGRGEVLAAALDRGADEAPARGPVDVPDQLGAAAERRHAALEAAAARPLDEVRHGTRTRPRGRPSRARAVVPILPQFSQMTLIGSQPAGWLTVETVR